MKIIVADHLGMCFGVRDAIAQAERLAGQAPLTILGELVHNPVVGERLRAAGVREKSHPSDLPQPGGTRVMITAHGASDRRHEELRARGFETADATCPLVRRAHHQLRVLVAAGYFPVVIGKRGHVEVQGLTEDFAHAVAVESTRDVADLPQHPRYGIISQTTQPIEHVRRVVAEIERARPDAEVRFIDTVCQPTKDRQQALKALVEQAETIVVVGGRTSNNTMQLVKTCSAAGRKVVHVERAEELPAGSFHGVRSVGVTAGTSTLPETVAAVVERLKQISRFAPTESNQDETTS
ncbi:MAG: 4-hydroxy-3-methylbut-2-enyl diphosphate reductase [Chthoniobacterales bacterium]